MQGNPGGWRIAIGAIPSLPSPPQTLSCGKPLNPWGLQLSLSLGLRGMENPHTLGIVATAVLGAWGFHAGHGTPLRLGVPSAYRAPCYVFKLKLDSNRLES